MIFTGERAAQFDGVHAEARQHILVHNGQLLHRIINPDRFPGQTEKFAQPRVRHGGDAGGPVS